MTAQIIAALVQALREAWGEGVKIYLDAVEQGLKRPCFFVLCPSPEVKRYRGRRRRINSQFVIQYLPPERCEANEACQEVADRLLEPDENGDSILELLALPGGALRGFDVSMDITGGVLSLFVTYKGYLYQPATGDTVETVDVNMTPKG